MAKIKRVKSRTRYFVRTVSSKRGWDINHRTKGGDFLDTTNGKELNSLNQLVNDAITESVDLCMDLIQSNCLPEELFYPTATPTSIMIGEATKTQTLCLIVKSRPHIQALLVFAYARNK